MRTKHLATSQSALLPVKSIETQINAQKQHVRIVSTQIHGYNTENVCFQRSKE